MLKVKFATLTGNDFLFVRDKSYPKNIDMLEQENKDDKVKANNYKNVAKSFKHKFNYDVDARGSTFLISKQL